MLMPFTVNTPSKAQNNFAYSDTNITDSNPARGMDVCDLSVFTLSCVGSGLAAVDHMPKEPHWLSIKLIIPEFIVNGNRSDSLSRQGRKIN
jgi:hypothetical protein